MSFNCQGGRCPIGTVSEIDASVGDSGESNAHGLTDRQQLKGPDSRQLNDPAAH